MSSSEDRRNQRVPGDGGGDVRRLVGGDHVGVGRVDDGDVLLGQPNRVEPTRQQIVRNRQLDEIDLLTLDSDEVPPSIRRIASLPLEKSQMMSAVVSTPPPAGIESASILVMAQPSYSPAVYWLIDST